jgi:hypothetical protein
MVIAEPESEFVMVATEPESGIVIAELESEFVMVATEP